MAVNTRPGIGKTEIVQAVADATGTTLFDLRLTTIAPQDLRRLPTCDHATRRTVWYRPEDLPDDPAAPVDPVSGRTHLGVAYAAAHRLRPAAGTPRWSPPPARRDLHRGGGQRRRGVFAPDLHPEAADKSYRIDPARLTHLPLLRRGGGTALAPALGLAARLQPSVAVIPTDPDGDPGPAPRFPGLWTVPDDNGVTPPPFGRVLSMAR